MNCKSGVTRCTKHDVLSQDCQDSVSKHNQDGQKNVALHAIVVPVLQAILDAALRANWLLRLQSACDSRQEAVYGGTCACTYLPRVQ
jgi:hypothetical protein